MMMGRYVELFMDYATQLECARSLTEKDFAIICSVGGSYLTRYPDICNAIPVQRVQDADHHPKPGQPLSQHRRLHPPVRHDQSQ